MTVVPHFASDEIESGDLNRRGDLTMWKRFNGSDAVRNALQACLLASVGVEGAVRPFVGKQGFIQKLANKPDEMHSGTARASRCRAAADAHRRGLYEALAGRLAGAKRDPGGARGAGEGRRCSADQAGARLRGGGRLRPPRRASERSRGNRFRARPRTIRCPISSQPRCSTAMCAPTVSIRSGCLIRRASAS